MIRHMLTGAAAAVAPLGVMAAAASAQAADVQIAATGPVVELSLREAISARPDIADFSAGVSTQAPTATEAMRRNAAEMNRVIDRIKALGISDDDIQTSGISLYPQYDYDQQRQQQVFRGYQAQNRVSVTLRQIDRLGEVLDALVAAGATDVSGPNWRLSDRTAALTQARTNAFAAAREQALSYARMAGYSDVRLVAISEQMEQAGPVPMMAMASMDIAERSTPTQPGRVEAAVHVIVKYELTR